MPNTTETNGRQGMTKNKAHPIFERGIPETFDELYAEHPLRAIHDKVSYENALEIVQALSGLDLNVDQDEYLETLGILINDYEEENLEILPNASPVEVLRFLKEDHNLSTRELGRILGKDESLGSKILTGERSITLEHAIKLAKYFGVKPQIFLDLRLK
jgi:HTH-type transcriptional regulator/antitoxin HigA